MTRIKIIFFLVAFVIIVIIGYFITHRSNDSIVEEARKIVANKEEVELLINGLDSVWLENQMTNTIILEIHDKRDYLIANCYNDDTLLLQKKLPRSYYINRITSNDIITVYKYTKEYLLLRRFIMGFDREEYSLIFFRSRVPSQQEAFKFIQTNFKNVKSIKEISNEGYLFSQPEN